MALEIPGMVQSFLVAQSSQSARELGYVVGQIAFYVLLAAGIIALVIWLWRRRR